MDQQTGSVMVAGTTDLEHLLKEARSRTEKSAQKPAFSVQRLFSGLKDSRARLRLRRSKARPDLRMPSGLSVSEAADLAGAIATALRRLHRSGQTIPGSLAAADIQLESQPGGWLARLPGVAGPPGPPEARALAALYYSLVTGERLPEGAAARPVLQKLAAEFPQTAEVLRQAEAGGYPAATEIAGAFGWSLYYKEQQPSISPARAGGKTAGNNSTRTAKPGLVAGNATGATATATRPIGLGALISLILAMTLLLVFIVFTVASAPSNAPAGPQARVTPGATAPEATPTPASGLQLSRGSDGSQTTRFNLALANPAELKSTSPDRLAPGAAGLLFPGRLLQAATAQWSVSGNNLYLGLYDGGWEVWDSAAKARISRRELPGMDQYSAVSWSPDGENFAALGLDGQLRLGSGGRVLRTVSSAGPASASTWQIQSYYNRSLFSWSPNGNYLLFPDLQGKFQLWGFQGGPQQIEISSDSISPQLSNQAGEGTFAWSPDSRSLAVYLAQTNQVQVFETRNLARRFSLDLKNPDDSTSPVAGSKQAGMNLLSWSPDGRYLALLRWKDFNRLSSIAPAAGGNQNNRLDIIGLPEQAQRSDGRVRELKPDFIQRLTVDKVGGAVYGYFSSAPGLLDWSRNGSLLVTGLAAEDLPTGGQENVYARTNLRNRVLIFEPAADGQNGSPAWKETAFFNIPNQDQGLILARWTPEGRRILVNTALGLLAFYPVPPGSQGELKNPPEILQAGQPAAALNAVPSPDGLYLAYQDSLGHLVLRDLQTGQDLPDLPDIKGYVDRTEWSPDGRMLAALYQIQVVANNRQATEVGIRVWRLENGKFTLLGDLLLPDDNTYGTSFGWNQDSARPALNLELPAGEICTWDAATPLPPLEQQRKALFGLGTSPKNFSGLPYKPVGKIWNVGNTGSYTKTWFPDWKTVVVNYDGEFYMAKASSPDVKAPDDRTTSRVKFDPPPQQGNLGGYWNSGIVSISPDGRLVAIGTGNGLVKVYDAASGKLVQAISAHQGMITAVKFSPDGKLLATGSSDRTAKAWDTTTWRVRAILRAHTAPVMGLAWLSDSKTLLTGANMNSRQDLFWRLP